MADPAKHVDILDSIKDISLGLGAPTYFLSFGGELWECYEYNHDPGFGTPVESNGYLLQRSTLSADLLLGPHLRFFIQGISGLEFFENHPAPTVQDDRVNLQMAFANRRRHRLSDGAFPWDLFSDAALPGRYVELFLVGSWDEHVRQHERAIVSNRTSQDQVRAFHVGSEPPKVSHLLSERVRLIYPNTL